MASGASGNGTQASLEDMLSTDVDESVVNALKGSLESQLCDDPAQAPPGSAQFQQQQQQQPPQQQQQQQPSQPLQPQQQQQTTIVAPAQHFQVATSTAITTSSGAVITTAQHMQTVSAVPVTAGGQQQMSAMHNLANVASQQSPIVVQKPQIHVQVRPEGEKQAQPTGLQLVNVQRNIKPAGQRVILSPIRMATQPQVIRTSNLSFPGVQLRPGTLLMRQDQLGQLQLVNVGGQPRLTVPVSTPAAAKRPGTQQVVSIHPSTSGHVVMQPGSTMAAPAVKPLTVQTSHSGGAQSSGGTQNTAAQMSPNTAKKKCKNFLATLIRLASDQPEQTATNVKALIQGLIDGNIPPEDFTTQLQRELNSSPQPCLVPFLKKSLPHLRQSLMTKELSIDGVRPPPPGSLSIGQPGVPQAIIRSAPPTTVRLLHPTRMVTVTPSPRAILNTGHMISTGMTKSIVVQAPTPNKPMKDIVAKPPVQQKPSGAAPKQPQVIRNVVTAGPNEKVRYGSALREDDDINDVAAMGGVNLQEESQRILASNDIVGATRSCGDDVFLNSSALEKRIHIIAKKHGLDTVDSDVIKLMSHAVQEKLKGYIERLNIISEHRAEPPAFKAEPAKFEPTSDVRSQLRFLDELDKLEKKRHEEHERELLIRVAKSRSKVEDPEQQKLKQRAKEMQKAEMEEMRQREANMTALQAIGFRKKPRLDGGPGATGPGGTKVLRPRIKRVNMKDMLFMLESDKHWMRSNFIYKNYLK